jgi:2-keto-4-pentenoate hydratase
MIDIAKAIKAINSSAEFGYSNEDFSTIKWLNGTSPISQADIEAKQVELQVDFDTKQYQRDRTIQPERGGYPAIGDQLDMIYHDQADGTTTFKDAIKAIKDAHPKP